MNETAIPERYQPLGEIISRKYMGALRYLVIKPIYFEDKPFNSMSTVVIASSPDEAIRKTFFHRYTWAYSTENVPHTTATEIGNA
ncbi:hypothetical protein [Crocosphaera chwakensis]|uniref:Uncharacterized protein n=1 Tax=Crocosphaera chwakensis CCY0110 TaxID=391612 RepID=A3IS58_9CHRO|nr:hypothetical protein [Crocosphaera chwakensis]EAZ90736.1 hypothetical protein CY0110_32350 [Crocosphaera chwakensis CCY0110]